MEYNSSMLSIVPFDVRASQSSREIVVKATSTIIDPSCTNPLNGFNKVSQSMKNQ